MFRRTRTAQAEPAYALPTLAELLADRTWCMNCGADVAVHQDGDCPDGSAGYMPVTAA